MIDKIYPEPNKELQELLTLAYAEHEEGGQVSSETYQKLTKLEAKELSEAATSYGLWHQNAEAKLRAKKAELEPIIQALKDEINYHEKRVQFIEWRIKMLLSPSAKTALTNEKVDIFYTRSERLEIPNSESVPIEYCEIKYAPVTDRIKQDLKAGAKLDFASLKENWNLQIKPGGEKAIANAKKRMAKREQEAREVRFEVPDDIL
jgi:hypothetical protein